MDYIHLLSRKVADLKLAPGGHEQKASKIADFIFKNRVKLAASRKVSPDYFGVIPLPDAARSRQSMVYDVLTDDAQNSEDLTAQLSFEGLTDQYNEWLNILDERERKIIVARLGLMGQKPQTIEEVGQEFGLHPERIRRLEDIALRKIRRCIVPRQALVLKPCPRHVPDSMAIRRPTRVACSHGHRSNEVQVWDLPATRSSFEKYLHALSETFLRTACILEEALRELKNVDWSSAVISVCKSLELELVYRLFEPIKISAESFDLSADLTERGIDRIAKFCKGAKPPELGSMAFFLGIAKNSKKRQETSPTLRCFHSTLGSWPESFWLIANDGLPKHLSLITTAYRNKAAHTEVLSEKEYLDCRDMIIGEAGTLWRTIRATVPTRAT
jgi:hypothetical protein